MIKNSASLINLLGELVKKLRSKNVWSQEHFAAMVGISTRTLQRIEAGEKANKETLRAIASFLNEDATKLVRLNEVIEAEEFTRLEADFRKEVAQLEKELSVLPRVRSGKELLSVVASFEALTTDYPPPISEEEGAAIATLIGMVKDHSDVFKELEPQQEMDCVLETNRCLEAVEGFGLVVFAGKLRGSIVFPPPSIDVLPVRLRYGGVVICRAEGINTFKDPNNHDRESARFRIPSGTISLS